MSVPGDAELAALVETLATRLIARDARIATAESCTGGWLAKCLTDRPGSSAWFEYGFVTYGNAAKGAMLGVGEGTLAAHGAVSVEVAEQMAIGARLASSAEISAARSFLNCAPPPKFSEPLTSTASMTVSSRSSTNFLMKGWPMRAVTFQSIARMSSPGTYSRTS